MGVTSFGTGCGDPSYPGVYARVSEVKTWIQETAAGTQDSDCVPTNNTSTPGPVGKLNIELEGVSSHFWNNATVCFFLQ